MKYMKRVVVGAALLVSSVVAFGADRIDDLFGGPDTAVHAAADTVTANGVTKRRLGSLQRNDMVVTDVSISATGGVGGCDTNAVAGIVTNYVTSGYIATPFVTNGLRSVSDLSVYKSTVSPDGPWTWSCTNTVLESALSGVSISYTGVYGDGGSWVCAGTIPGGWVMAAAGTEPPDSLSVTIPFSLGYGTEQIPATASRPLIFYATNDTLSTESYVTNYVAAYDASLTPTITNIAQFATDIWTTVSSYIPYFEEYATNNYWAARLANFRAKRLEEWQYSVSNDLLLASGTNGLKSSPYFSVTNEQLVSTITNEVAPWALNGNTKPITDLSSRTTREDVTNIAEYVAGSYRTLTDNTAHSPSFSKWVPTSLPTGYTPVTEQPRYYSGRWVWSFNTGAGGVTLYDLTSPEDATTITLLRGSTTITATREVVAFTDDVFTTHEYVDAQTRFTKNIKATANIGVHTVDASKGYVELELAGKTIEEGLRYIMAKTSPPTTPTYPKITSVTLTGAGAYEVGTTFSPSYSVSADTGSYTYDGTTGVTYDEFVIYDSNAKTNRVTGTAAASTTQAGTFDPFTVKDNTGYRVYAKAHHGQGNLQHDNQGNESSDTSLRIASRWCQDKASEALATVKDNGTSVTGYRPWYVYSGTASASSIDAYFVTNTSTKCMSGGKALSAKSLPTSYEMTISAGTTLVAIAIPKYNSTYGYNKEVTDIIDYSGGFNLSIFDDVHHMDVDVTVAGSTVAYRVWYYSFPDGLSATKFTIKFSVVAKASAVTDSLKVSAMADSSSYASSAPLLVNMHRQYRNPLDSSALFYSKADLDYYVSNGRVASGVSAYWSGRRPYPYSGQVVTLAEPGHTATNYMLRVKDDGEFSLSAILTADEVRYEFASSNRVDGVEGDIADLAGDVSDIQSDYVSKTSGGTIQGDLKVSTAVKVIDATSAISVPGIIGAGSTTVSVGLDGISREKTAGSTLGATSSSYTYEYPSASGKLLLTNDIVHTLNSTATDKALSAGKGKELQDQITNLKQRGRYLSVWNSATGMAMTVPPENPYYYTSGDYFIIGVVTNTVNYAPSNTAYTCVASGIEETREVKVNDTYYYDGTTWTLLDAGQVELTIDSVAGLSDALNATSAYLRADAKATDSDKLDGNDASYFAPAVDGGYLSLKNGGTVLGSMTVDSTLAIGAENSSPRYLEFGAGSTKAGFVTAAREGGTSGRSIFNFGNHDSTSNTTLTVDDTPVVTQGTGDARYLGKTSKAASASDSDKLGGNAASYYAPAVTGGYMPKSGGDFTGTVNLGLNTLYLDASAIGAGIWLEGNSKAVAGEHATYISAGGHYGYGTLFRFKTQYPYGNEKTSRLIADGSDIATSNMVNAIVSSTAAAVSGGTNIVISKVGGHSVISVSTDDGSRMATTNMIESVVASKGYAEASALDLKVDAAVVDYIYKITTDVDSKLVCYSRDGTVAGVTNVTYGGAAVYAGPDKYDGLTANVEYTVYTNGYSGYFGECLKLFDYTYQADISALNLYVGENITYYQDDRHVSGGDAGVGSTIKTAIPVYSKQYAADTKKFEGKTYVQMTNELTAQISTPSDVVRTKLSSGAYQLQNGLGMVVGASMVGAVAAPDYYEYMGTRYLQRSGSTYSWAPFGMEVVETNVSYGVSEPSSPGYNFNWAMYSADTSTIAASNPVVRISLRMPPRMTLSNTSCKFALWDNDPSTGNHSDAANKIIALSDNVVTLKAGTTSWANGEFGSGVSVQPGHRLILMGWNPDATWESVSNVTWSTASTSGMQGIRGYARQDTASGTDGDQISNGGTPAYKYRLDTVFTYAASISPLLTGSGSTTSVAAVDDAQVKSLIADAAPSILTNASMCQIRVLKSSSITDLSGHTTDPAYTWSNTSVYFATYDNDTVGYVAGVRMGDTLKPCASGITSYVAVDPKDGGTYTVTVTNVKDGGFDITTSRGASSHYALSSLESCGIMPLAYATELITGSARSHTTNMLNTVARPFVYGGSNAEGDIVQCNGEFLECTNTTTSADGYRDFKKAGTLVDLLKDRIDTRIDSSLSATVDRCHNYVLTNLTGTSFTLPSGYMGTLKATGTSINAKIAFPDNTGMSGDCVLRVVLSGSTKGSLSVSSTEGVCVIKHLYGLKADEMFDGENLFYITRIGYENGTNTVLVTRQSLE